MNILLYIRMRTVSVRKIPYALSFFISFQNISRENVCLTFGHLYRRQGQVVQCSCEANKLVFELLFNSFFHLKDYI